MTPAQIAITPPRLHLETPFDLPLILAIRHRVSRAILFLGRVADPSLAPAHP